MGTNGCTRGTWAVLALILGPGAAQPAESSDPGKLVNAIGGRVLAADTGEPIAHAQITVVGSTIGALSDALGNFELGGLGDGVYQLNCRHVAYDPPPPIWTRISYGRAPAFVWRLEPRIYEIASLSIEAQHPPPNSPPAEAGGIVTRLDFRDLVRGGHHDLAQALQAVPGLEVRGQANGGPLTASVRGIGASRVIVLVDGERLNDPATGVADLRQVNWSSIRQIEIRRGVSGGALGGLGGVISILTHRRATTLGPGGAVQPRLGVGTFGFLSTEVSARSHWHGNQVQLSVGRFAEAGDSPVQSNSYPYDHRVNGDQERLHFRAQLGLAPAPSLSLQMSGHWRQETGGDPGSLEFVTPLTRIESERTGGQMEIRRTPSTAKGVAFSARVAGSRVERSVRAPADQLGYRTFPRHTSDRTDSGHATLAATWGLKEEWGRWSFLCEGEAHRIRSLDFLAPGRGIGTANLQRGAFDLHWRKEWPLASGELAVEPGVRSEHPWDRQGMICPRVGLEWIRNEWALKAATGRAIRPPSANELLWTGDLFIAGNPELDSEVADHVDLGIRFQPGQRHSLEINGWWSEIEDLVQWQPTARQRWIPVNLARAQISGLEIGAAASPSPAVDLTFSATLQSTESKAADEPNYRGRALPLTASFHGFSSLRWHPLEQWRTHVDARHVGRQFTNNANTRSLPAATFIDWGISYWSPDRPGWHLGFEIMNVTNIQQTSALDLIPLGRKARLSFEIDSRWGDE